MIGQSKLSAQRLAIKLLTFGACIDIFTRSTHTVSRLVQLWNPSSRDTFIFLVLYAGNKARVISITNCLHLKVAEDNPESIRIDFADILMNVQLTSIQVIQIQLDRIETT
jgi:hypothetical protein